MIIKEADDKQPQIAALRDLAARLDADAATKKRIEQEIRNIQAGLRGEQEAAYEMRVHYGESRNWALIHDLRIEQSGLAAQIDHLIINRSLDVWVCESKNSSEGVAINEHGEFAGFFGGKPYGVPSPIEQNDKHILILRRLFESGTLKLPKRLGFTIKPELRSLVLVSKSARISRAKRKIPGVDCVIKSDQLFKLIDRAVEESNPLMMAKVVSSETLEDVARRIAKLHRPVSFDWAAKFALSATPPAVKRTLEAKPVCADAESTQPKSRLVCHSFGDTVAYNVARFCWFNKAKFGGNVFCMDCQKTV